jgi:hypothetical protein
MLKIAAAESYEYRAHRHSAQRAHCRRAEFFRPQWLRLVLKRADGMESGRI